MTNETKTQGEVADLASAQPLIDIRLLMGRDGSIAISIEPEDVHPAIVVGALEMAKTARLLSFGPARHPTQAGRHADRVNRREGRGRQ